MRPYTGRDLQILVNCVTLLGHTAPCDWALVPLPTNRWRVAGGEEAAGEGGAPGPGAVEKAPCDAALLLPGDPDHLEGLDLEVRVTMGPPRRSMLPVGGG